MNSKLDTFLGTIKEIYGRDYPTVEKGLKHIRPTTFRVNRLKAKEDELVRSLRDRNFVIKKGPFVNSYIVDKEPTYLSDTDEFKNGEIYVQELSSMIPPILIDPKPGEKILDMAAAPGSKTTQLGEMGENQVEIVSIERNPIRIKILDFNIKTQGIENVKIIEGNGVKFDRRNPQYIEYFDKVQVDAPCSTEGNINISRPQSYKYWNIHKRKDLSRTQKGMLISGIRMLKPGGTLVYSTCTFGVEENELVLDWLLDKYPELEIEKISLPINNIRRGLTVWKGKSLNPKIKKAIRIIPNELFSGFFVAKISKNGRNFPNEPI